MQGSKIKKQAKPSTECEGRLFGTLQLIVPLEQYDSYSIYCVVGADFVIR